MGVGRRCVDNQDIRIIIGKCGVCSRETLGVPLSARGPLWTAAAAFAVE